MLFKCEIVKRKKKRKLLLLIIHTKIQSTHPGNEIIANNFINKLNKLTSCNKFVILQLP